MSMGRIFMDEFERIGKKLYDRSIITIYENRMNDPAPFLTMGVIADHTNYFLLKVKDCNAIHYKDSVMTRIEVKGFGGYMSINNEDTNLMITQLSNLLEVENPDFAAVIREELRRRAHNIIGDNFHPSHSKNLKNDINHSISPN